MSQRGASEMDRAEFNEAVILELERRGRYDVADMSALFDSDMGSMSAATVAGEEGLGLTADAVDTVADAREYWYENHYEAHL